MPNFKFQQVKTWHITWQMSIFSCTCRILGDSVKILQFNFQADKMASKIEKVVFFGSTNTGQFQLCLKILRKKLSNYELVLRSHLLLLLEIWSTVWDVTVTLFDHFLKFPPRISAYKRNMETFAEPFCSYDLLLHFQLQHFYRKQPPK